jgi:WD40-like Beta Propeller Repeat
VALLAALVMLLTAVPFARADVFGSASLLSADVFGQAEYAHDPAASEDGAYVVFDGSVGGVPGVWRRETRAGAPLEQVAGGDAAMPSVSADGRYISFTTNEGASLPTITNDEIVTGAPTQEEPGVYVRDMDKQPNEVGAFTLASAKDHSVQSLSYEFPGASEAEVLQKRTELGAVAGGPSAITANGRTVVFVTTAQSDLAGPETPARQVAVRHLDSEETELVTVRYDPATGRPALDAEGRTEPVRLIEGGFGGVYRLPVAEGFTSQQDQIPRAYKGAKFPGASISADGSAVAWLGQNIGEQVRTLPGEGEELAQKYAEPLWRRIAGGPSEPTRRVTGGADVEDPECEAHPEARLPGTPSTSDPCQGPFATQDSGGLGTYNAKESEVEAIPRLSANGDEVAFVSSAKLTSQAAGIAIGAFEYDTDAYREDMTAPSRKAGLAQVTQFASSDSNGISTNANVTGVAISPDGEQVAFTTRRTVFPLAAPAYVSVPAAVPGLGEVYDADLGDKTLTRVTTGYEGSAPQHAELASSNEDPYDRTLDGALWPSFSDNGQAIVFSSTASNLVFGDGNTPQLPNSSDFADGADVFLVPRITFSAEPTPQTISPAPPNPAPEAPFKLTLSASSLRNGVVLIRVKVPTAGKLVATAASKLARKAHKARRGVTRTVAKTSVVARSAAPMVVELKLALAGHYRSLAGRPGGLRGTVTVTYAAKGHPTLKRTLTVRFVRKAAASRKGKRR